jgi:hypothetical protein
MGRMQGHRLRVCALAHAFHQRGESVRPQNQVWQSVAGQGARDRIRCGALGWVYNGNRTGLWDPSKRDCHVEIAADRNLPRCDTDRVHYRASQPHHEGCEYRHDGSLPRGQAISLHHRAHCSGEVNSYRGQGGLCSGRRATQFNRRQPGCRAPLIVLDR